MSTTPAKQCYKDSVALRAYLTFANYATGLYQLALQCRLAKGKEHPTRYREKLAVTSAARPTGTLIWMHGVGLGEVLALRGLIRSINTIKPDIHFLVTSTTRTSAEVFSNNLPAQTIHQFLPIDCTPAITRFLDHWQPDISLWAEQDLWPALVCHTHRHSIPLVLLNARMNEHSYQSRARLKSLYRDLYRRFEWISAQDSATAKHMNLLGANGSTNPARTVTVGGSLKTAAVPLKDNVELRELFQNNLNARHCWLLASSHHEDEMLALETHRQLLKQQPDSLLIIAPRLINRKTDILANISKTGLRASCRSDNQSPDNSNVYVADTFGEMGIWYRLCPCALIGGSMNQVQGHNPWEAAILGCAIIHGPHTSNFLADYNTLHQHHAATRITNAAQLLQAISNRQQITTTARHASNLARANNQQVAVLAARLLETLDTQKLTA